MSTYIKYLSSGIFTKIHSILFMIICVELIKIPINLSYIFTFFYSVYFNFICNTHFTFKNKGRFSLYITLVLCMLCLNFILFKIVTSYIHYVYANMIVSLLTYPIHFFINKKFIFVHQLHRTQ
ncbi:MAG: GtrA-like protein [Candidatus Parcubacteria bacterium]|jgi:putative flippase GtrA